MGDVESFLALEMALNSYPLPDYVLFLLKHYQKPPLGPGFSEKSLGFKELRSPLYLHFTFYTSFWLFKIFHTDSPTHRHSF